MQTFLPYADFTKSAECLDRHRLNKQRLEVRLLLEELDRNRPNTRWNSHPCVRMWRGHAEALREYGVAICEEWISREYKDAQLPLIQNFEFEGDFEIAWDKGKYPDWFGTSEFHSAHRSNLLRKNPDFYGQYDWEEPDNIPYVWPFGKDWPDHAAATVVAAAHNS